MATVIVHKSARRLNLLIRMGIGLGVISASLLVLAYMVRTKPAPPLVDQVALGKTVRTLVARRESVVRTWSAYGTARSMREADVAAQIASTIVERPNHIEPGARVAQGDLLVRLEDREFVARATRSRLAIAALRSQLDGLDIEERTLAANVRSTNENVELLHHELELMQTAARDSGVSQVEIDRLRRQIILAENSARNIRQQLDLIPIQRARLGAEIGVEESNLELADIDLSRTRIVAPISGVLQEVMVREGERVAPGELIAHITDLSRMEVPLAVPLGASGNIGIGAQITLRPSSRGSVKWHGTVARLSPDADPNTRTFTVFVEYEQELDNDGPALLPGQFVTAELPAKASRQAVLVPRTAIVDDRVLVLGAENRVESRAIGIAFFIDGMHPAIDPSEREWAVIAWGLEDRVRIIVSNLDELQHGMLVNPETSSTGPTTETATNNGALPVGGNGVTQRDTTLDQETPR